MSSSKLHTAPLTALNLSDSTEKRDASVRARQATMRSLSCRYLTDIYSNMMTGQVLAQPVMCDSYWKRLWPGVQARTPSPTAGLRATHRPRPLTLMRSRGCVQQAAPHDASPPKYQRDIRFSVMVPGCAAVRCSSYSGDFLSSQSDLDTPSARSVALLACRVPLAVACALQDTVNLVNLQTFR